VGAEVEPVAAGGVIYHGSIYPVGSCIRPISRKAVNILLSFAARLRTKALTDPYAIDPKVPRVLKKLFLEHQLKEELGLDHFDYPPDGYAVDRSRSTRRQ
jgi:hypothetical protein